MYLLDTNHCISLLNGEEAIAKKLASDALNFAICVVVKGELLFGAANSKEKKANLENVRKFVSALDVIEIEEDVSEIYGDIKAKLRQKFAPSQRKNFDNNKLGISDNDLWIACVAIKNDLVLLSNDTSDFPRIKEVSNLKLDNWLSGETTH